MKQTTMMIASLVLAGSISQAANSAKGSDVNNTKVNERDAQMDTLTPVDQSQGTKSDVELTRKIRQEVVADKSFSTDAQNVKIITLNGMVTLRGPVATTSEKQKIDGLAKRTAGVKKVDNQLEVKSKVE
ncbi:MAG: BON domain-containing protein [Bdellovibrionaceae bacterium]|nr:BON domain-containing protein [Pseudobdellovibrionaceae bacterium]